MTKQIKRLLLSELSSKRKLAKSLNWDLPVSVKRSDDNNIKIFYMLHFVNHNIFLFDTWVEFGFNHFHIFHLKKRESYLINDLKQDFNLSESWFEPFVNE